MQFHPKLAQPPLAGTQHVIRLGFVNTMHYYIIHMALEVNVGKLPSHPHIERKAQEQIRQGGKDRRSLRSSSVPPLHTIQHSTLRTIPVGVGVEQRLRS